MIDEYVVVDLEMTGLNPVSDSVIEIGAVKVEAGKVTCFETLVKPTGAIPGKVQQLCGITDEMAKEGREPREAFPLFFDFAGELPLVGHHLISDFSFLKQWAYNHKMKYERNGVDTLYIARDVLADLQSKSLDSLCEYYGIERKDNHRALADAMATMILFRSLATEFYDCDPRRFRPKQLQYKAKKISPVTKKQKEHLQRLLEYHKLTMEDVGIVDVEQLTQSEVSRKIDKIILEWGRVDYS